MNACTRIEYHPDFNALAGKVV
jgi:hypothetical protein